MNAKIEKGILLIMLLVSLALYSYQVIDGARSPIPLESPYEYSTGIGKDSYTSFSQKLLVVTLDD